MAGRLLGIARKAASRAPMEALNEVAITCEGGLEGDYRGRHRTRQVTVMGMEDWRAACGDLDVRPLPSWTIRRANLLVEGLPLPHEIGACLRIGDVVLEVRGETDPCHRMDEALPGLRKALAPNWRGGVSCRVLEPGRIRIGDRVNLD